MRQITPPFRLVQKILGDQKTTDGIAYRLSAHCLRVTQPEGVLLYHTLTGELLLLSREEAEQLKSLPGSVPPALAGLVPLWFLRPAGADEMAFADQTREIAARLMERDTALTKYLIFTTTACNARCFYCFEAGIQRKTMTEETARAAGASIAAHCGGRPVQLVWFGGEPLVNVAAIDVITGVLRERGVPFRSRMDSNGYLFDEALARRAKADWGLEQVQIPVDGTEDVYNQRKAYVHAEGSPYRRVLRNIGLLLDTGVQVVVRLNMDADNEQDLYALTDALTAQFGGRPGFSVCFRVLIENKGVDPAAYTQQARRALAQKAQAMDSHLREKGVAFKRTLPRLPRLYSCWAGNPHAATITPDGRLGRCEAHIDKGLWGSVFSEERDEATLQAWRARREPEDFCRACALYPRCIRLKKCVMRTESCSPIERTEKRLKLERAMRCAYEDWKAGNAPGGDAG